MPDLFDSLRPGTRVVVRHRLPQGGVSDALGDFLGVEEDADGRHITVATRRGDVRIATDTVTHAKPVPPPPARRERGEAHKRSEPPA